MAILLTNAAELVILLISLSSLVPVNAKRIPFSANLIHRDSPLSPFYNPNKTWHERWIDAVKRSYNRAVRSRNSTNISPNNLLYSDVSFLDNEYLMSIMIGSTRHETLVMPDSASNLIWVQCEPCNPNECTHLNYRRYNPQDSRTYRPVSFSDPICQNLHHTIGDGNECIYGILYFDESYSRGKVARENLVLSSTGEDDFFEFQDVVFGCSHANAGIFGDYLGGMLGIGPGAYSFIRQGGETFDNTFSYCLPVDDTAEEVLGKIVFGIQNFNRDEMTTTRLYVEGSEHEEQRFYLNLKAISINDIRYEYPATQSQQGNIIIDSGASLTLLPPEYYHTIANALSALILEAGAESIPSPEGYEWASCYDLLQGITLPTVTMHFDGGSLVLQPENLYVNPYRQPDRSRCIGIGPFLNNHMVAIYGAVAQTNFWVEYNLNDMILSFLPADCPHAGIQ